jgi:hypothetical protein
MVGIVGLAALLIVLGLSLVITRIATTALVQTGLSPEAARFQARSAFTGTGFTTGEAEKVVGHPVRRKIITLLMILRSAGLVTIVISLILSFAGAGSGPDRLRRLAILVGGVLVLWLLANSRIVDRSLSRIISRALSRWTDLDLRDYASLLKLSGDYTVNELTVRARDWLENKQLDECRLHDEGLSVLGIYRSDGRYVGAPKGTTRIHAGDTLIVYGHAKTVRELDERRGDASGEVAHRRAVDEQQQREQRQQREEAERERGRSGG